MVLHVQYMEAVVNKPDYGNTHVDVDIVVGLGVKTFPLSHDLPGIFLLKALLIPAIVDYQQK